MHVSFRQKEIACVMMYPTLFVQFIQMFTNLQCLHSWCSKRYHTKVLTQNLIKLTPYDLYKTVIECKKELSGRDGFGAASSLLDFAVN